MQRSSPSLRKMIDQLLQASRPHNCSPLGFSVNPWHLAPGDCEGEQTATISWISPFPAGENCHLVDRYQKSLYTCVYIYIYVYILAQKLGRWGMELGSSWVILDILSYFLEVSLNKLQTCVATFRLFVQLLLKLVCWRNSVCQHCRCLTAIMCNIGPVWHKIRR